MGYTSGMRKYRLAAYALGILLLPAGALAAASVAVTPPYPGTTIIAGTRFSFSVLPSGFTNPTYLVVDSFGGGANSSNIDASGAFFYSTNQSDVGTHSITITASDSLGNTASAVQTVTVAAGPTLTVDPAATTTVTAGYPVTFTMTTQGLFNPVYSTADLFAGSSLRASAVGQDGVFNWTPIAQDIGVHTILITAKDSFGYSTTSSQKITIVSNVPVVAAPAAPAQSTSTPAASVAAAPAAAPVVPAVNAYTFRKYLQAGSTGAEVTALQKVLISAGYLGASATGYFGALTRRAVMAYQSANGVQALGVVGPATRAVLNRQK